MTLTTRRYATLVAAIGTSALVAMLAAGDGQAVRRDPALFIAIAALVAVTEWFPVRITGTDRSGWLTVSLPFIVALLLLFGAGPAALTLVAASILADLRRRQPGLHVVFNAGQYSLTVAAAATFAGAFGTPGTDTGHLETLLTGVAFVVANNLLTIGIVLLDSGEPGEALRGLLSEAIMDATLLLAAPVVVLVAQRAPLLLPVLLLPAFAVHRGARLARRTEHAALHDHLTGLPNRELFRRRLARRLQQAQSSGATVGVGLIDLDDFRTVNDTLGHRTGDLLLQQVAARLTQADLDGVEVARLGGDEFGLIIAGATSPERALKAAHAVLAALHESFSVEGFALEIEASIGVSVTPDHGEDVDTLLRCADIAMYSAKDHGGVALYAPLQDTFSEERLRLLADLRGAIDNGEFVVHYQPKVDLRDGRVCGVEALVRWQHPTLGLLSPGTFIPLAERTAHIDALTMAVIDGALLQHRRWRSEGFDLPVAVNVPPHTLLATDFPGKIRERLAHHGVDGTVLEVEITEGTIMRDRRRAADALLALRSMGVRVAIDDFGTGYGSLSYLRELPVDVVKIDRAFVAHIHHSDSDRAIVESTVALAHRMGKRTVAEGVEEADSLAVLRVARCDEVQGFLFARPEPADRLSAWLRAYRPLPSAPLARIHEHTADATPVRRVAS